MHGLRQKLRLLCAGKPYWATKDEFGHGWPRGDIDEASAAHIGQ
jgi:predicted NUDIX family NTP pyrophosphohydrolase